MSENNIKAVIEALLFISDKPLALEKIKDVLDNLETTDSRKILEDLGSEYEKSNRGIRITEIAGGFQMTTVPRLAPFLKKLYKDKRIERLSKPALETLAIIAYKQPITKLQIESLRNVNVDGVIKNLLDKGFIRVSGRKNSPGRPFVFGTNRQFLEYFGLKSLQELPRIEDFQKMLNRKDESDDTKEST